MLIRTFHTAPWSSDSRHQVQLVALGRFLQRSGIAFWNLGHPPRPESGQMVYKSEIGKQQAPVPWPAALPNFCRARCVPDGLHRCRSVCILAFLHSHPHHMLTRCGPRRGQGAVTQGIFGAVVRCTRRPIRGVASGGLRGRGARPGRRTYCQLA